MPIAALAVSATAAYLTPEDFGVQAVLLIVVSLAHIIIDLGLPEALIQLPGRPTRKHVRMINGYRLGSTILFTILLYLFSTVLLKAGNLPTRYRLLSISCPWIGWLQSTRNMIAYRLKRNLEWVIVARVEFVEVLVYNTVLIVSAYALRSPVCFFLALAARHTSAIAVLVCVTATHRLQGTDDPLEISIRELLRFGMLLQAPKMMSFLQNLVNPGVFGSVAGLQSVGIIDWSTKIMNYPRSPLQPLPMFFFSIASAENRDHERAPRNIVRSMRLGADLMAFISLTLALLLPWLVSRVFGEQWSSAIPVTTILLAANITYLPTLVLRSYIDGSGFPGKTSLIALMELILVWVVMGGLAWALGPLGYATGVVFVSLISFSFASWIARRTCGISGFFRHTILVLVLAALAFWIGDLASQAILSEPTLSQALISVAFSLVVLYSLMWLLNREVVREDFRWVLTRLLSTVRDRARTM